MTYCTNCGKEHTGKICRNCGVKHNTTHNFCQWCGREVDSKAVVCVACKERIRPSAGSVLSKIISYIVAIWLLIGMGVTISDGGWIMAAMLAFVTILILPISKELIRRHTFQKLTLRKILNGLRILLACSIFLISLDFLPDSSYEIYKDTATVAAEVVFHEEVSLKNKESFTINDTTVTYSLRSNSETAYDVYVEFDYSTQNGFGGMNRDTYSVTMIFDSSNGVYYRTDGSPIS